MTTLGGGPFLDVAPLPATCDALQRKAASAADELRQHLRADWSEAEVDLVFICYLRNLVRTALSDAGPDAQQDLLYRLGQSLLPADRFIFAVHVVPPIQASPLPRAVELARIIARAEQRGCLDARACRQEVASVPVTPTRAAADTAPVQPAGTSEAEDAGDAQRYHAIHVRNFPDILSAYGEWFAESLLECLCARAAGHLGRDGVCVIVQEDRRFLFVGERLEAGSVETMLAALGSEPVVIDGTPVLTALSMADGGPDTGFSEEPPTLRLGKALYRRLMAEAVAAYKAMAERRLTLAFQSISSADGESLLYRECLARIVPEDGGRELIGPGAFLPALEQLGLIRLFDRAIVLQTLTALRTMPSARLGCNISAQSAVDDAYWTSIFALLAAEPQTAARLIIEITETAALPAPLAAQAFVARLKRLGCEVALDDFGVGCNSISLATMLRPGIVKVDGSFLRGNVGRIFGGEFLQSLIGLSACLAAHVVLEGVEDETSLRFAQRVGARWLQGYYIQQPSIGGGAR